MTVSINSDSINSGKRLYKLLLELNDKFNFKHKFRVKSNFFEFKYYF